MKNLIRIFLLSTIFGFLAACTGGITVAEGGISGSGISYGRASTLTDSSVVVNGSDLTVDNLSQINIDEQTAVVSDLKVGQLVRVDADFAKLRVIRLDYVETVRGPVTSATITFNPDTLAGSFDLLGQTIITNSTTVLDNISNPASLAIGDVLDVSGIRNSTGAIIASYIQQKTSPVSEYRVIGVVSNLTATTFTVGNLTINFTSADTSGLTDGVPIVGTEIRARGPVSNFDINTNSFAADKVNNSVLGLNAVTNSTIEIEGIVTSFSSISNFSVNGLTIDASNAIFEDCVSADIALNVKLEIEGEINAGGILNATKVEIKRSNSVRIEANVDRVISSSSLVVLGITIKTDINTQLEDDSNASIVSFSLQNLSPGDRVEIKGSLDNNNMLVASRLERKNPETDVRLQAKILTTGFDPIDKTVTLLDLNIRTNGSTSFKDADDETITDLHFFDLLSEGSLVKAKWDSFTLIENPVDELSLETQ
jgi:hypothetical protein